MNIHKRKWVEHLDNTKPEDGFESLALFHDLSFAEAERLYQALRRTDAEFRVSFSLLNHLAYFDEFNIDDQLPCYPVEYNWTPFNCHVRFRNDADAVLFKLSIV